MRSVKYRFLNIILIISAAVCLLALSLPFFGVIHRCCAAFSAGIGESFLREWLPSHIFNTIVIAVCAVALSLPLGLFCAVYITVYSEKKTASALKTVFSALSSVPSAVYGLFGFFLFSRIALMRYSVAAGIITMAVLLLGSSSQCCIQALSHVDERFFAASLSLGATVYESVKGILLPCAAKGIIFGAILCLSKAAGESAALIFTCGTGLADIKNGIFGYLFSSGETLSVGIYQAVLNGELPLAFAACGVIMLIMAFFGAIAEIWRKADDKDR